MRNTWQVNFLSEQRLRLAWAFAGCIIVAAIIYLSTAHVDLPPGEGADKYQHALAYGVLTFWWAQLALRAPARCALVVGSIALGVSMELVQGLLPYRSMEMADAVADAIGTFIGWAAAPPRTPNLLARLRRLTGAKPL